MEFAHGPDAVGEIADDLLDLDDRTRKEGRRDGGEKERESPSLISGRRKRGGCDMKIRGQSSISFPHLPAHAGPFDHSPSGEVPFH